MEGARLMSIWFGGRGGFCLCYSGNMTTIFCRCIHDEIHDVTLSNCCSQKIQCVMLFAIFLSFFIFYYYYITISPPPHWCPCKENILKSFAMLSRFIFIFISVSWFLIVLMKKRFDIASFNILACASL